MASMCTCSMMPCTEPELIISLWEVNALFSVNYKLSLMHFTVHIIMLRFMQKVSNRAFVQFAYIPIMLTLILEFFNSTRLINWLHHAHEQNACCEFHLKLGVRNNDHLIVTVSKIIEIIGGILWCRDA